MPTKFLIGVLALLPWVASGAPPGKRPVDTRETVADPLDIPEIASARRNPLSASEDTLRVGHGLWRRHCQDCHGAEGRGDGPDARLHERRKHHAPRNLTDPNVQENLTDGDIFWRISRGIIEEDNNVIMPAFEKKVPSEADRWHLVLFVRELGRARR